MKTNYAVAPGEYLQEWLEENGLSQAQVAERLGWSRKLVNELVNGHARITPEHAIKLGRVTEIPADAWNKFEVQYRSDLARLQDEQSHAQFVDRIHPVASKFLRDNGFTTATKKRAGQLVSDFLTYHRCGSWSAYEGMCEGANAGDFALAALTDGSRKPGDIDPTLLTTWLRAGELHAAYETGRNLDFDPQRLRDAVPELRERAARPDEQLLSDLAALLRRLGVIFLVVPALEKLPLHGVTTWIDKRVPVIQQSGRRNTDGFLIWAFFHEVGHVLNDPRGEMHVDLTKKQRQTTSEKSANRFAEEVLFGPEGLNPFRGLQRDSDIRAASELVGVAPGVAVQQMHRRRMLDYQFGNRLCVDLSGTFQNS